MPLLVRNRILRNYHRMGPRKFFAFIQGVVKGLTDNPRIPVSTWGSNPELITSFLTTSAKFNEVYHKATFGSVLDIAERELLEEQLIIYLDEIAADLEAEAVRNPDILLSCGFDLAKERRGINTRKKVAQAVAEAANSEQRGDGS